MTTLAIVEVLVAVAFFAVLGTCSYVMKYGKKEERTEGVRGQANVVCEN